MSLDELQRKAKATRSLPAPAVARAIRLGAGLSQDELAAAFPHPVTRSAVSLWESGRRRPRGIHLVEYVELLDEVRRSWTG